MRRLLSCEHEALCNFRSAAEMQMDVARKYVSVGVAFVGVRAGERVPGAKRRGYLASIRASRMMKAVTTQDGRACAEERIAQQLDLDIAEANQLFGHLSFEGKRTGHGMYVALARAQLLAEVHHAAAFRVDRTAGCGKLTNLVRKGSVRAQLRSVKLRVAPAKIKRVRFGGKFRIVHRAELDELCARTFEQLQIVLVVEAERFIARHTNRYPVLRVRRPRCNFARFQLKFGPQQEIEIQPLFCEEFERVPLVVPINLSGRMQTQVTLRNAHRLLVRHPAQNRRRAVSDNGIRQQLIMLLRRDPIQYDSGTA